MIQEYQGDFDKDKYVYGASHIYGELLDEKKMNTKNKWNKQKWCLGDFYQGINTSWKYKNGVIFELQFHTPESFSIKNKRPLTQNYKFRTFRLRVFYPKSTTNK